MNKNRQFIETTTEETVKQLLKRRSDELIIVSAGQKLKTNTSEVVCFSQMGAISKH